MKRVWANIVIAVTLDTAAFAQETAIPKFFKFNTSLTIL